MTQAAKPGVESLHAAAVAQKKRIVELQSQLLKGAFHVLPLLSVPSRRVQCSPCAASSPRS